MCIMFFKKRSNVLQNIVKRLTSKAKNSKNVMDGSVYFTSPQYKLQYAILSGLGDFVVNLNVLERNLYDVFVAVTHYLDRNQPIMLQVQLLVLISIFFLCSR